MCVCVCFAINKYIIAWTIDGGLQSCEFTCNFVVTFCTVRRVVGMWGVTDVWATRDATVMPMMDACNRFAAYLWIDRATHAHYPQIDREKKRIVSCARWKRFFYVNQFPFTKVSTVEWTKHQIRYVPFVAAAVVCLWDYASPVQCTQIEHSKRLKTIYTKNCRKLIN